MLESQRFDLRRSEVRERINAINAQAELADGEADELARLNREFSELETRYRAAIVSEAHAADAETREQAAAGEGAEVRELRGKVNVADYMRAACSVSPRLEGAAAEYNAALGIEASGRDGVLLPIALLGFPETRAETRADAPTTTAALDGGQPQRPIMQRIFGPSVLDALGVRLDSVPAGRPEWPLLTGGVAPAQTAENTAKDSEAATFVTQSLRPRRLTASYQTTAEQMAEVAGIEEALRRDLSDAARSVMNTQAISGDGTAPNVTGFLTRIAAPGAPSNVATFADYTRAAAQAVDGLHAMRESEVSGVIGVASYRHAAGVYQSNGDESAIEAMTRRMMAVRASSYIPAAASDIQNGNLLHAGGGGTERGDSIAAMWPAMEIIRDPYTDAASGRTRLTLVILWNLYAAFRTAAYARVAFKLA